MSSRPRSVAGRFDGLQRVKIEIVEDDDILPSKKRRNHEEVNAFPFQSRLAPVKDEEEHAEEKYVKEEENSDYVATPATPAIFIPHYTTVSIDRSLHLLFKTLTKSFD